jgi:hypothetical protein
VRSGIDLIDVGLGFVLHFDVVFALLIGFLVLFGFLDHAVDIGLAERPLLPLKW